MLLYVSYISNGAYTFDYSAQQGLFILWTLNIYNGCCMQKKVTLFVMVLGISNSNATSITLRISGVMNSTQDFHTCKTNILPKWAIHCTLVFFFWFLCKFLKQTDYHILVDLNKLQLSSFLNTEDPKIGSSHTNIYLV